MNKKLLIVSVAILGSSLFSASAMACQQPNVNRFDYSQLGCLNEGLAVAKPNGKKYGYLKQDGEVAIPFQYEDAFRFKEGLAPVKKNGKWGYIDKSGDVIIRYQYEYASDFLNGKASVRLNGKMIKIDKSGNEVK